ncbi:MAG: hypothetical protein K0S70_1064 [Microbacterium sp.]|nr:hypothetical protein [Microbacterium sp.]
MDDARLVDNGEATCDIPEHPRGRLGGERTVLVEVLSQSGPLDELHDEKPTAVAPEVRVVEGHQRRVIEPGEHVSGGKAARWIGSIARVGAEDLHGDVAREDVVARAEGARSVVESEGLQQPVSPPEHLAEKGREGLPFGAAAAVASRYGAHTRVCSLSRARRVVDTSAPVPIPMRDSL